MLNRCGETAKWNFKGKTLKKFREAEPFWTKWTAAGHKEQKLVNLITRLKSAKSNHREGDTKGTPREERASKRGRSHLTSNCPSVKSVPFHVFRPKH